MAGVDVNATQLQRRISGTCSGIQAMQSVAQDGTVVCGTLGVGTITGVTAGTGLTGGGTSGAVTVGIAPSGVGSPQIADASVAAVDVNSAEVQRRVSGNCPAGQSVQAIAVDGTVSCESSGTGTITGVTAATGLTGGGTTGAVTIGISTGGVGSAQIADGGVAAVDVNSAEVQRRVAGNCVAGQYVRVVNQDGTVICDADANSGGTVTSVATGAGLSGGPITGSGTIAVAAGGIGNAQINATEVQRRVTGTCAAGQAVQAVAENGTVTCQAAGVGTITGVTAGTGLSGGGTSGAVSVAIAAGGVGATQINSGNKQARVSGNCPAGQYVRVVNSDGTVVCGTDASGTPGWGLTGNAGTNPASSFLGTTDNQPLGLRANNQRTASFQSILLTGPVGGYTANVLLGSPVNSITTGVRGATVSGGGNTLGDSDPDLEFEGPNRITDHYGIIAGGTANLVGNDNSDYTDAAHSTIGGGFNNIASGGTVTIAGGGQNTAGSIYSTIGGGSSNSASAYAATIAGGDGNIASQSFSTIEAGMIILPAEIALRSQVLAGTARRSERDPDEVAGGASTQATGIQSTVSGGTGNIAGPGDHATVAGGGNNTASGFYSTVSGGQLNTASGIHSTIAGGAQNASLGSGATIAGGVSGIAAGGASTVSGGSSNAAIGNRSIVSGGYDNCAGGDDSWAGGFQAKVRPPSEGTALACAGLSSYPGGQGDRGTFVWADAQAIDFVSSGSNQFLIRAQGGIYFGTNSTVSIPAGRFIITSTGAYSDERRHQDQFLQPRAQDRVRCH